MCGPSVKTLAILNGKSKEDKWDASIHPTGYSVNADKAWILTWTGRQFFHLRPTTDMVCI